MSGLLIIGAGGHGSVVADTAIATGLWSKIAFLDDAYPGKSQLYDWPILGRNDDAKVYQEEYSSLIVAVEIIDFALNCYISTQMQVLICLQSYIHHHTLVIRQMLVQEQ